LLGGVAEPKPDHSHGAISKGQEKTSIVLNQGLRRSMTFAATGGRNAHNGGLAVFKADP
jgi:hypothetical protein